MSENRKQILEMLAQGKINAVEAEKLIAALEKTSPQQNDKPKPKYLRIVVESDDRKRGSGSQQATTKVNIRVPMQLLRAGVKLASLIPAPAKSQLDAHLKEHGIQMELSQLKPENLEELIEQLTDLTVDVDDAESKVRIFCE